MNPDLIPDFVRKKLRKRYAYKELFYGQGDVLTQNGADVLEDLARFCFLTATTTVRVPDGAIDPIASAQAEGRRQVILRILGHLKVQDPSQFLNILEQAQHD